MSNYFFQTLDHSFSDLYLNFCGYEECEPLHKWGPVVRPVYIIHYILSGKGTYQTRERSWSLGEGEGFLIEPEALTFYQADAVDPWTYIWIGFGGEAVPEVLRHMGLGQERLTFRSRQKDLLKETVFSMLRSDALSFANDVFLQSQMYLFFSVLLKDLETALPVQHGKENAYISKAVEVIRNNYYLPIKVSDIAEQVHVNRSYLCTIFQKELGVSISEYLSSFRLTRAAELLPISELDIGQVAFSCGYRDPLVFSKAFKRKYGMPPLKFRQEAVKENMMKMKTHPEI